MSNQIKDGGPAFPVEYNPLRLASYKPSLSSEQCRGMTLRDYFAGQALTGWLASFAENARHPVDVGTQDNVAKTAYGMADAMLKAREVKP